MKDSLIKADEVLSRVSDMTGTCMSSRDVRLRSESPGLLNRFEHIRRGEASSAGYEAMLAGFGNGWNNKDHFSMLETEQNVPSGFFNAHPGLAAHVERAGKEYERLPSE